MNLHEVLTELDIYGYQELFTKHLAWAFANNRVSGTPKFPTEPDILKVFGIRCNAEADFNYGKYNDYLILLFNDKKEIIEVTVDPNRDKNGIAHLRQGCWNSYVIRPHKYANRYFEQLKKTIPRWAICQDKNEVEIVRTDGNRKVIKVERGFYGINVGHDNGGYPDSSAGCTVVKKDKDYLERYLPLIFDIKTNKFVPANHNDLTYCLINYSQLETYGITGEPVLASSEGGVNIKSEGAQGK